MPRRNARRRSRELSSRRSMPAQISSSRSCSSTTSTFSSSSGRARATGSIRRSFPGLMPITNFEQIQRFTAMCGATIPPKLRVEMDSRKGDAKAVEDLGVSFAAMQAIGIAAARIAGHSLLHAQSVAGDARRRLGDPGSQHVARRRHRNGCVDAREQRSLAVTRRQRSAPSIGAWEPSMRCCARRSSQRRPSRCPCWSSRPSPARRLRWCRRQRKCRNRR